MIVSEYYLIQNYIDKWGTNKQIINNTNKLLPFYSIRIEGKTQRNDINRSWYLSTASGLFIKFTAVNNPGILKEVKFNIPFHKVKKYLNDNF